MTEDRFEQDFVWYEWSFVSPDDLLRDDLKVPSDSDTRGYSFSWKSSSDDEVRHDGMGRWTT